MSNVDLIYNSDCPNIGLARGNLLRACIAARRTVRWREWLSDGADTPAHLRGLASPSIVVDGAFVDGAVSSAAACCRVYRDPNGELSGAPSEALVVSALCGQHSFARVRRGGPLLTSLPAFGAVLLPKLTCPLCWPAYSAVFATLGIGFVDYTPWLLPVAIASLTAFLTSLAWSARRSGRWLPLLIGLVGSATFLIGEFAVSEPVLVYAGGAALLSATFLSLWRRGTARACAACHDVKPELETVDDEIPPDRSVHRRLRRLRRDDCHD